MIGLKLNLRGSSLFVTTLEKLTSNGTEQFQCVIEADERWADKSIHIGFNEHIVLVVDGMVTIPSIALEATELIIGAVGVSDESTYTTNLVTVPVITGLDLTTLTLMPPTEWEQYINLIDQRTNEINEISEKLKTMAINTPYIGENGNWYIYDYALSEYVDSEKPSIIDESNILGQLDVVQQGFLNLASDVSNLDARLAELIYTISQLEIQYDNLATKVEMSISEATYNPATSILSFTFHNGDSIEFNIAP